MKTGLLLWTFSLELRFAIKIMTLTEWLYAGKIQSGSRGCLSEEKPESIWAISVGHDRLAL